MKQQRSGRDAPVGWLIAAVCRHPIRYAALLADKMQRHGTQAWLVNTGVWVWGGARPCVLAYLSTWTAVNRRRLHRSPTTKGAAS
jgi:hypothetical protein